MKDKIHPKYVDSVITCSCGNVIHTRSTRPKLSVDICSACHPFFTGKQKLLDAAGRVEKFRRKFGDTAPSKVKTTPKPKRAPTPKAAPKPKAEKKPKADKPAKPAAAPKAD